MLQASSGVENQRNRRNLEGKMPKKTNGKKEGRCREAGLGAGLEAGLENDQIHKSSKSFNFWAKLAKSDAIERWMGSLGDRSVDQNYQKRTQTIDRSKIA